VRYPNTGDEQIFGGGSFVNKGLDAYKNHEFAGDSMIWRT
jgi:hypothetical protein